LNPFRPLARPKIIRIGSLLSDSGGMMPRFARLTFSLILLAALSSSAQATPPSAAHTQNHGAAHTAQSLRVPR